MTSAVARADQGLLERLGLFPAEALLDDHRSALDQVLGLLQPEAGGVADRLDGLDLALAEGRQADRELQRVFLEAAVAPVFFEPVPPSAWLVWKEQSTTEVRATTQSHREDEYPMCLTPPVLTADRAGGGTSAGAQSDRGEARMRAGQDRSSRLLKQDSASGSPSRSCIRARSAGWSEGHEEGRLGAVGRVAAGGRVLHHGLCVTGAPAPGDGRATGLLRRRGGASGLARLLLRGGGAPRPVARVRLARGTARAAGAGGHAAVGGGAGGLERGEARSPRARARGRRAAAQPQARLFPLARRRVVWGAARRGARALHRALGP